MKQSVSSKDTRSWLNCVESTDFKTKRLCLSSTISYQTTTIWLTIWSSRCTSLKMNKRSSRKLTPVIRLKRTSKNRTMRKFLVRLSKISSRRNSSIARFRKMTSIWKIVSLILLISETKLARTSNRSSLLSIRITKTQSRSIFWKITKRNSTSWKRFSTSRSKKSTSIILNRSLILIRFTRIISNRNNNNRSSRTKFSRQSSKLISARTNLVS